MNKEVLEVILPNYLNPYESNDLVRLGNNNDGGYVVNKNDINESSTLVSLGISFDWSFEREFKKFNKKAKLFCFDGSVGFKYFWAKIKYKIKTYLSKPSKQSLFKLIDLIKLTLGFVIFFKFNLNKKRIRFYESFVNLELTSSFKNNFQRYHGYNPKNLNFETVVKSNFSNRTFLCIDIEGSEYSIINDLIKHQEKITCLVIEFHEVDKNLDTIKNFISNFNLKLLHLHINNFGPINNGIPTVIELTFSRSSDSNVMRKNLPIKIDQENNSEGPEILVTFNNK